MALLAINVKLNELSILILLKVFVSETVLQSIFSSTPYSRTVPVLMGNNYRYVSVILCLQHISNIRTLHFLIILSLSLQLFLNIYRLATMIAYSKSGYEMLHTWIPLRGIDKRSMHIPCHVPTSHTPAGTILYCLLKRNNTACTLASTFPDL